MTITVRYSSIDRFSKSRSFKTIDGARRWARYWVGNHPEIGSGYAVSGDGVGKITVRGCTLDELFAAPAAAPVSDGYSIKVDVEEELYRVLWNDRQLAVYDTIAEANEHIGQCREYDTHVEAPKWG